MDSGSLIELSRARALARSGSARTIRIAAGVSLGEVAEAVGGVSASTVYRWETGERRPTGEPGVRYWRLLDGLMRPAPR